MVFSSLLFIFLFLPITLLMYYGAKDKWKNIVLFIMSLLFYAWGEPVYILLMIFSTIVDYTHGMMGSQFVELCEIVKKLSHNFFKQLKGEAYIQ